MLRRVCDRLIIFAKDGAEYFDGGYDDFLVKIGWEEEENTEKVKAPPKENNKENKKLKAELVRQRNQLTTSLKKKVEQLEGTIIEIEDRLEMHHKELILASSSAQSKRVMELSKTISEEESKVAKLFEELEVTQTQIDTINYEFEQKIEAL